MKNRFGLQIWELANGEKRIVKVVVGEFEVEFGKEDLKIWENEVVRVSQMFVMGLGEVEVNERGVWKEKGGE